MDDQRLKPTSAQSTTSPTTQAEDARGEARCQSTPPQDQQVRMRETPVPDLQPVPAGPLTPHVLLPKSQDSGSHSSQMSALSSWKTGATPARRMKQQLVMRKLLSSITEGHHHDQQHFHSHQNDPCQHLRQQTTQHRVIPTKLHHRNPQRTNNRIMKLSTLIQTITSYQMAVIGASMTSQTRFSTQDTWKMETMRTYYTCQNLKICYTQADSSWMKHQASSMLFMAILIKECPLNLCQRKNGTKEN